MRGLLLVLFALLPGLAVGQTLVFDDHVTENVPDTQNVLLVDHVPDTLGLRWETLVQTGLYTFKVGPSRDWASPNVDGEFNKRVGLRAIPAVAMTTDQRIEVRLAHNACGSANDTGVIGLRGQSADTYYALVWYCTGYSASSPNGWAYLVKSLAGVVTTIASGTTCGFRGHQSMDPDDLISASAVGNVITAYRNGAPCLQFTDTIDPILAPGHAWIGGGNFVPNKDGKISGALALDDIKVWNMGESDPPPPPPPPPSATYTATGGCSPASGAAVVANGVPSVPAVTCPTTGTVTIDVLVP